MPLYDAASGFFAHRTSLRDIERSLIEQWIESAARFYRNCFWFGWAETDGARALAGQRSGGGQLASDDGNHAGGAFVGMVMKKMPPTDCGRLVAGRVGERTNSRKGISNTA